MYSLDLLKQLVEISSDKNAVSFGGRVEYGVACWLRDYVQKNLRSFTVEEQKISEGRMNLFIHDNQPTSLLFLCHIDTVEEGNGWTTASSGEQRGLRFYGRGSADMKCGAVAILAALHQAQEIRKTGLAVLFYADEEYDSLGIKKFVAEYENKLCPKLIVCTEPTEGKLRRGCRGVVELRYILRGKTGHAARSSNGINVFDGLNQGVNYLQELLKTFEDPYLGHPTLNVARVRCGAIQQKRPDGFIVFGSAGNIIPDYAEVVLEVRTIPGLDSEKIKNAFHEGVKKTGVVIESVETKSELGSFITQSEQLKLVEDIFYEVVGGDMYQAIEQGGYSDVQMLASLWQTPTVIWGAAGGNVHGVDEYVDVRSFEKLETGLKKLVARWEVGSW